MTQFTFTQLHQVAYQTTVTANTEAEARAMLDDMDWDMNENTLVEAGDVVLEEVR